MATLSSLVSSGGGSATLETVILTKSQTWTPPVNGTGIIHVIGAGASGGGDGNTRAGGAGGYSRKAVTFATGTNWTIVVGAGGLPTSIDQAVIAGGNSTAADGSSSLTANGAATSGYGGTASGGDVNFTGGTGGQSTTGGGGAVGVFANGSTTVSISGGQTTDANGGADSFLVLGLGQLIGGSGGGSGGGNGGFLSGGGNNTDGAAQTYISGGKGGIGGGGGMGFSSNGSSLRVGGAGGDGLVVIQYLTVT